MNRRIGLFASVLVLMMSYNVYAKSNSVDHQIFEKVFTDWTSAFNHRDLRKSCELFSKSVVADYQGSSHKNYQAICNGFKRIFKMQNQKYIYRFSLHDVYVSGDLATVRITWYLRLYENGKLKSLTKDEGIDIFEKDKSGVWRIVNYIGYDADHRH